MPTPLSADDAARYREIFRLQDAARWSAADGVIATLGDKLLLGEVEAQRYLSPRYHARFDELAAWLGDYGDEEDAARVYRLALARRPAGAPSPAKPVATKAAATEQIAALDGAGPGERLSRHEARRGRPAPARDWSEGLAAWRTGRLEQAGRDFQALARSSNHSDDLVSAAAFWAGRVELRRGRPELYNYWLGIAAENPRTFYGLLARRTLGLDTYIDFDPEGFTQLDAQIVDGLPAGRRVLALLQVGQRDRAEDGLRLLALRASPNVLQAVQALTERADLPGLGRRARARLRLADDSSQKDKARFPVPHWKPRGGFQVDRALIYGLMRQESKFQPHSRSAAGATGLMQLMPETARAVAARSGVHLDGRHARLTDPATNLALAQQYVLELLGDNRVNGNLLYLAVAYNRGPGALAQIKAEAHSHADPLMFIESIRNRETRDFIHKVLTNYWIYRLRLGQPTPDLDALAAGEWPIYTALDDNAEPIVRHAEN